GAPPRTARLIAAHRLQQLTGMPLGTFRPEHLNRIAREVYGLGAGAEPTRAQRQRLVDLAETLTEDTPNTPLTVPALTQAATRPVPVAAPTPARQEPVAAPQPTQPTQPTQSTQPTQPTAPRIRQDVRLAGIGR